MHHIVARETRPDAQALFHLIANLARALTASLTACARSRIHFKRHDLRFHVLSLARRWWEAHSLILGHPLSSSSSPLFPSLSLPILWISLGSCSQRDTAVRARKRVCQPSLANRFLFAAHDPHLRQHCFDSSDRLCSVPLRSIRVSCDIICVSHISIRRAVQGNHMVSIWWSMLSLSCAQSALLKRKVPKGSFCVVIP